jgi:hypothetical protein
MRAQRTETRSVVTGRHASQGMIAAMLLLAIVASAGGCLPTTLGQLQWAVLLGAFALLVGSRTGYRLVIERDGITVWMTCFSLPWRGRRYSAAAMPSVYWAQEDADPSGVVITGAGDDGASEYLWIFGTPRGAFALETKLREEIAHVRRTVTA